MELGCWCKPEACHGDILIKLYKEKIKIYSYSTLICCYAFSFQVKQAVCNIFFESVYGQC